MKEKPSFWDDYFKVLPWSALALIALVAFFFTLQKDVSILWSCVVGPVVILLIYMSGKIVRNRAMKILVYVNLIYWSIFVIGALVAKMFGLPLPAGVEFFFS